MKEMFQILKDALNADSSTSSKRLCGMVGWIVCLICVIIAVLTNKDSPNIVNTLFLASTSLLGLDSVVSIFKTKE